ncbi:uncharacterized protein LOC112559026 isoform X1 [Pomacea canaliculata]|uniref:uncharacterized protein LOC112559026 isoform X1 n=2 Tax=Pomacea canaliculata TaxID=400727 RepID=UPI000D734E72|nr:uncharacterized protein LOC112559026 isoform X1 [Pomacea canaliculata]
MKSSEDMISIGLDSDSEARLVKEAVDKAYEFDTEPAPKASSFDTMLCLDISSSMMKGGAFDEMKRAVNVFIDGVEDAVNESGTEENIGLVTFGDHAVVAQNLTNDFSRIREKVEALKPEGKSPFVEALLVAMAAFVRKGGVVSVSGEWNVRPRIIFISDGYPTESTEDKGLDVAKNINHVRAAVSRMLISFKASSSFNQVHPIVFVPVGSMADKFYMKAMSDVCGGCYKESANIRDLCYYFRTQDTIGKVIVCLKDKKETVSQEEIRAVVKALAPDLRHVDEKEIVETIQNELKNPERRSSIKVNPRNVELNNVYENTEKVNLGYFLPLGTRVVRGPDWTYGDQDGNGPGTVISHEKKYSWHWVEWDSGEFNCYPQSPRKGFHLMKTDESPRIKTKNLEIGMVVKKGLKWNKRDGDEHLEKGVIIRKSDKEKKVVVRWSNGELQVCTYSNNGPAEVEYWNGQGSIPNVPGLCKEKEEEGKGIWQWNDGSGNWINYDLSTNEQIEKQFLKHNVASVLIYRDGKQRRIMFKRKTERLIDGNLEYDVQRI